MVTHRFGPEERQGYLTEPYNFRVISEFLHNEIRLDSGSDIHWRPQIIYFKDLMNRVGRDGK